MNVLESKKAARVPFRIAFSRQSLASPRVSSRSTTSSAPAFAHLMPHCPDCAQASRTVPQGFRQQTRSCCLNATYYFWIETCLPTTPGVMKFWVLQVTGLVNPVFRKGPMLCNSFCAKLLKELAVTALMIQCRYYNKCCIKHLLYVD